MPEEPGRPARLRPWVSTRELTAPPDASGPGRTVRRGWRGLTGYGCIALAVAVVIAGAAFGASPHRVLAAVHGVSAWLANDSQGSVTRANGLSGRADARIKLAGTAGHRLKVIQDGSTILIEDLATHTVTRIDPADLTITQTAGLSTAGTQIVVGAGLAYLIDPHSGTVVPIDPVSLTVDGRPLTLTAPLGANPGITSDGTLWVPDEGTGALVPIRRGAAANPVPVGRRGDTLSLTIAEGRPAVVDATADTLTVLATGQTTALASAAPTTINLPATGGAILAPPVTPGSIVPLLFGGQHQLVVVNVARNTVSSVPLAGLSRDHLDAPLALGSWVYVPDESQGALVSYDAATRALGSQIAIGSGPGPIDSFEQDGVLWANSPGGARAVAVDSDGTAYSIGKYQPGLPGGPLPHRRHPPVHNTPPPPAPGPSGPSGPGGAGGSGAPGGSPDPGPTATGSPSPQPRPHRKPRPTGSPTPTQKQSPPPPTAPGTVTESAQVGSIAVTFTPVSTGTPLRYLLAGAPAGATVTPAQVRATGPFGFTVTGLSCAQTYAFAVTAVFANGQRTSAPAADVRPCLAPGAPGSVTATAVDQGIDVSWTSAAANGGTVTYTVSWTGADVGSLTGVTGNGFAITGLTNQKSYTVSVIAVNEAGSSQTPATATATLSLPAPVPEHIYNNSQFRVNMRQQPSTSASILTWFGANSNAPVTVICQTTGGSYADPSGSPSGDIWDYVSGNGFTGYVADGYVTTPESVAGQYNSFSTPMFWHC